MDLRFDHKEMLHLIWLAPLLGAVYLWGFSKKRQALARFATLNLLPALIPSISHNRQRVRALLVLIACALLAMAMSGPRWGMYFRDVHRRGIDIVFALDVSRSMLAEDILPNRLERAKLEIKDMIQVLPGDRIGLVTFAGSSTKTCPLTNNYGAFRLSLDDVTTRSTTRGGTNLGDAIRFAADCFTDKVKDHKAIILITDGGETEESYAVEAALKVYEEHGIRVFTVGFGDISEGARIPVTQNGRRVYLQFEDQEVWAKLDPSLLQSIAAAGDGGYFHNTDFRAIHDYVQKKVQKQTHETEQKEVRYARFQLFAWAAFLLLMLETLLSDRKANRT